MFRLFALIALSLTLVNCTKKNDVPANSVQFALNMNLSNLDPAQVSNEGKTEVTQNMFEGLLEYHYLKRPLVTQPLLAAAPPEVSKDGLVHKFKIKKGVRFHDSEAFPDGKGRLVTSKDFVYSWKRLADPANKSEGYWIFDGKIKGLNEWRDKFVKNEATYDAPVEGLLTPDDETLIITLTKPYYQLHYVLTMPYASVVPKEAVDKYGQEFMNHPVGTGPYVFDKWIRGNKVTLKRNPNWHGGTYPTEGGPGDQESGLLADAGKALPFVDELVFHEMPEDQPRWLNMMKGMHDFGIIPKDNFDGAVVNRKELKPDLQAKGMKLTIYLRSDVVYIGINMDDPVLGKNVELRRALAHAYDSATANEKFYNNRVIMAHSPIAPEMEAYDENFKNPYKEFSIEKAKAALKKAGYPEGKGLPPIEYSFSASSTGRQMAEYLAQQFEKIGVKVNLVSNSWPQFTDRLRQKKSQMYGIAWGADYPDPENMLQLLYGKNESPGPSNSNFKNKEFDKLYEQAAKMPPGPARAEVYKKMRDIFVREMPWIPTVHRLGYTISQGWLNNLKRNEQIHGFYKYLRVDLDKKKELKAKF